MDSIDIAISFDTTGSMYPCLTQVRRHVENTVHYLFKQIEGLRVGIIGHGDYCDGEQVLTMLDLSDDEDSICRFIRSVPATSGGDSDECYEFVLNRARTLSWTGGKNKAFVMIGDANPHKVGYRYGSHRNDLDWKNELQLLLEAGIAVYPIQALGVSSSNKFYNEIATMAETDKLELEQFSDINDVLMALCFSRAGKIKEFEQTLNKRGNVSYSVWQTVDRLAGRKSRVREKSVYSSDAVHPSRFQVLSVDNDCSIKEFVERNGLYFKQGRGFYEFTRSVKVQDYKEVIIRDRKTGEMFSGDKAREILGIPIGVTAQVRPEKMTKYEGFIQSTSTNRKLLAGTKFLYEVSI